MRQLFFSFLLLVLSPLIEAQNKSDIQITWIQTPTTVHESHLTLKWGIKAKAQITDVNILLNGATVKGLNAVVNDGFDMKKSQVVSLSKGDNIVELVVTTKNGSIKEARTITLLSGNDEDDDNHNDIGEYINVDSMIMSAYRGDEKAQYLLGMSYLNGTNGLEKDLFESSLWFKKSAESLYAPAQYEYAISLYEGRGILKSKSSFILWLIESAKKDFAEARLKLGICYEMGDGVKQNIDKAKEQYRKCPLPEARKRLQALEK